MKPSTSAVDTEVMPGPLADAHRRRLLLIGLGTVALLGSWLLAWLLPAPRLCVSLYCGENFNPDQVRWRALSFWNWPQLIVVVLGLLVFATMILLAARRSGTKLVR